MISVIIPAFNEEKRIQKTLKKITDFFKGKKHEILVIDDGSNDRTRYVVKKFSTVILNSKRKNMGKGFSVKEGVLMSKGDLILISDADLSTPIEEFDKLFKYFDKNIVIGSRALKKSIVQNNIMRKILGKFGNLIIHLIVKDIKDTQCGFKIFDSKIAKKLFNKQTINGFGFDFEILFLAQKYRYQIKEVPIVWNNVEGSKVKPIHYFITLIELLSIIRNNYKHYYNT